MRGLIDSSKKVVTTKIIDGVEEVEIGCIMPSWVD